MRFTLDRTLTVPLAVQLAGQIEYAVICGDLRPGERLPTVRELAEELGVAPVTVSGVYRALRVAAVHEVALPELLQRVLGSYDAVVYATGSEDVVHRLPRSVPAFEFRHVPDTRTLLASVRAAVGGLSGG